MQWLEALCASDMILTSYFHASCYSILLEKPFISVGTKLKRTKLEELLFENEELRAHYIDLSKQSYQTIDWEACVKERKYRLLPENYVEEKRKGFLSFLDALRDSK